METITCDGCKAYYVNFEGSRHQCRLGYAVKCLGLNKFIATHSYGPVEKCPKPLTDEKLDQLRGLIVQNP
ncbi:MAG: hypothetical protein ACM3S2_06135 [Ignavibacteriales bacterium]